MSHRCTTCDRTFSAGSTEMLSGCPDCGGNRFQFVPEGSASEPVPSSSPSPSEDETSTPPPPEDRAQAAARSSVVDPDHLPRPRARAESEPPAETDTDAATEPSRDDDADGRPDDSEGTDASRPPEDAPADVDGLRTHLEDRFESIRIVEPGQYELDLLELYEREECIIELGEHGRYAIHVPETLSNQDA